MTSTYFSVADVCLARARDVLTLVRFGVPFAEARSMADDERKAYLDAFAGERGDQPWKSGLPQGDESEPAAELQPEPVYGISTIG